MLGKFKKSFINEKRLDKRNGSLYENMFICRLHYFKMRQPVNIFKALSDPTRLRILLLLFQKELCVCELTAILEMEQSRISHQLRVLRNVGLVEDIREGKWIIYRATENTKKGLNLILGHLTGDNLTDSEEIIKGDIRHETT